MHPSNQCNAPPIKRSRRIKQEDDSETYVFSLSSQRLLDTLFEFHVEHVLTDSNISFPNVQYHFHSQLFSLYLQVDNLLSQSAHDELTSSSLFDSSSLPNFLDFCYGQPLKISFNDLRTLLNLAHLLEFSTLLESLSHSLKSGTPGSSFSISPTLSALNKVSSLPLDCSFSYGGKTAQANRLVVASFSKVWKEVFTDCDRDLNFCFKMDDDVTNVDERNFVLFFELFLFAPITVTVDNIGDFYYLANLFSIADLLQYCNYVLKQFTSEELFNLVKLSGNTQQFQIILDNFEVFKTLSTIITSTTPIVPLPPSLILKFLPILNPLWLLSCLECSKEVVSVHEFSSIVNMIPLDNIGLSAVFDRLVSFFEISEFQPVIHKFCSNILVFDSNFQSLTQDLVTFCVTSFKKLNPLSPNLKPIPLPFHSFICLLEELPAEYLTWLLKSLILSCDQDSWSLGNVKECLGKVSAVGLKSTEHLNLLEKFRNDVFPTSLTPSKKRNQSVTQNSNGFQRSNVSVDEQSLENLNYLGSDQLRVLLLQHQSKLEKMQIYSTELRQTNCRLNNSLRAMTSNQSIESTKFKISQEYESSLTKLEHENNQLKQTCFEQRSLHKELLQEYQILKNSKDSTDQIAPQLQSKLIERTESDDSSTEKLRSLQERVDSLVSQNSELLKNNSNMRVELETSLRLQDSMRENEVLQLEKQDRRVKQLCNRNRKTKKQLDGKIEHLKNQLKQSKKTIASIKSQSEEVSGIQQELARLKQELGSKTDECASNLSKIQSLELKCRRLIHCVNTPKSRKQKESGSTVEKTIDSSSLLQKYLR
ncbi:hypothetical protein GEMRC1_002796 [Eukaryota sp. GEM-RC1]